MPVMNDRLHLCLVPDSVKGKRVLALDLSALISGTGIRGEFEKRFKSLLNDVREIIIIIIIIR